MPFSPYFYHGPPNAKVKLHKDVAQIGDEVWTFIRPKFTPSGNASYVPFLHVWMVEGLEEIIKNQVIGMHSPAEAIVHHIAKDLGPWLRPDTYHVVEVPDKFKDFALIGTGPDAGSEKLCLSLADKVMSYQDASLGAIFFMLHRASRQHREALEKEDKWPSGSEEYPECHMRWADANYNGGTNLNSIALSEQSRYQQLDLRSLCSDRPSDHFAAAIISLMRWPQYTDATPDGMFERYMKVAIDLLFGGRASYLPQPNRPSAAPAPRPGGYGTDAEPSAGTSALVVTCGCTEFSETVRNDIATHAQKILSKIIDLHVKKNSTDTKLPPFCFVYGIHWSISRVRILAHFAAYNTDTRSWQYTQVVLAEHMHGWSIPDTVEERPRVAKVELDDAFLRRWRLTVALLKIRSHVDRLSEWLPSASMLGTARSGAPSRTSPSGFSSAGAPGPVRLDIPVRMGNDSALSKLRDVWRDKVYAIPQQWRDSSLPSPGVENPDHTAPLVGLLLALRLRPIGPSIRHLDRARVPAHHPSYNLEPCLSRLSHTFVAHDDRKDVLQNTTGKAHQLRLLDMLSMEVTVWSDINIFIAAVFSAFRGYELQWCPAPVGPAAPVSASLDFRLTLREASELHEFGEISATFLTSPSSNNPVVLLGTRICDPTSEDSSTLSVADWSALGQLVAPYIEILQQHLAVTHTDIDVTDDVSLTPWYLFVTCLKAEVVHIVAIPVSKTEAAPLQLVDSLPITMSAKEPDQCAERLRVFVALSTIQQHVIRFAQARAGIQVPKSPVQAAHTTGNVIDDSQDIGDLDGEVSDAENDVGAHMRVEEWTQTING